MIQRKESSSLQLQGIKIGNCHKKVPWHFSTCSSTDHSQQALSRLNSDPKAQSFRQGSQEAAERRRHCRCLGSIDEIWWCWRDGLGLQEQSVFHKIGGFIPSPVSMPSPKFLFRPSATRYEQLRGWTCHFQTETNTLRILWITMRWYSALFRFRLVFCWPYGAAEMLERKRMGVIGSWARGRLEIRKLGKFYDNKSNVDETELMDPPFFTWTSWAFLKEMVRNGSWRVGLWLFFYSTTCKGSKGSWHQQHLQHLLTWYDPPTWYAYWKMIRSCGGSWWRSLARLSNPGGEWV